MKLAITDTMKITGEVTATIRDAKTGRIKRVQHYKNLNPNVIKAAIISHLFEVSPSPSSLFINYGAVGTGTNAPSISDTQLQTEIERVATFSSSVASKVGYLTLFFTETQAVGTIREAGIVAGGTASANTGTLVSRVATNITKSITETLTLDWSITIN